jgi:gas vesicle protein
MKRSKLTIGAILGASAGIVAGLLTAPKSGKETRDDIRRKAGEVKGNAAAKKDDIIFKVEEMTDDLRSRAAETIETVKSSGKNR